MTAEPWHGTANGYNYHGCRLDCCQTARRLYYGQEPKPMAPPGPVLPRPIAVDYCSICGCHDWHWAGCQDPPTALNARSTRASLAVQNEARKTDLGSTSSGLLEADWNCPL